MNVMYAADDVYAEIAGVSIESLLTNNKGIDEITIYFVEDSISEHNKNRLYNTAKKYNREMFFLSKPDIRGLCGTELTTLRWSDSAYSRLYLNLLFEKYPEIHKLLYLDCDTMIVGSLDELWNENIDNYLGAAVYECMSNMHKRILGAKPEDNYVNTGMILFNVDKWKKENIGDVCSEFIKRHKGKTEYVDQGVINGTVSNRFKIVDPRYNLTALSWDFNYEEMRIYRKPAFGYDKKTWENAISNPCVIHFTTSFLSTRPWFDGDDTPWTKMWRYYKSNSEWAEEQLRVMKNRKKHDLKIKVFNLFPRKLGIHIAGILHSFFKPIFFVIKANG